MKVIFVLVVQFTFVLSRIAPKGFVDVVLNSPLSLFQDVPKQKVKEDSNFERLQTAYYKQQRAFYSESRSLRSGLQDGIEEVLSSCKSCIKKGPGKEITRCYSSCMTKQMDSFSSYGLLIGDIVHDFFCEPLGFGFENDYTTKYPQWLMSFENFVSMFNENVDAFSPSSLTETWMANLLWLDISPLNLYSYIRGRLAQDIAQLQNNSASEYSAQPPAKFAAKCGSKWDLRETIYTLIHAVQQKNHYLDVILPGLFAVRGAAFYTRGNYVNLAGGIMEALATFIGRKCNIIGYSDGLDENGELCDGIGKYPIPQLPIPPEFINTLSPCEELQMSPRIAIFGD